MYYIGSKRQQILLNQSHDVQIMPLVIYNTNTHTRTHMYTHTNIPTGSDFKETRHACACSQCTTSLKYISRLSYVTPVLNITIILHLPNSSFCMALLNMSLSKIILTSSCVSLSSEHPSLSWVDHLAHLP